MVWCSSLWLSAAWQGRLVSVRLGAERYGKIRSGMARQVRTGVDGHDEDRRNGEEYGGLRYGKAGAEGPDQMRFGAD